ncbi:MAG: DUF4097 family beta strand repeat-containing protein [Chloroflexota bacterium]
MIRKTIKVKPNVRVIIPAAPGDLKVTGWEREEIMAKADDILELTQDGDEITITCDDDLSVTVPAGASLQIDHAGGDVDVHRVSGPISFGSVMGDLSMRQIGPVTLGALEGDLSLRGVTGDVNIGEIGSDASLREVQGNVTLSSVEEDLYLQAVSGNVNATVSGDAVLHLDPRAGTVINVTAEDDILLHLPESVDAAFSLSARDAEDIHVQLPGAAGVTDENPRAFVLGSGAASVALSAGGDVLVTSRAEEWEDASEFADFDRDWPLPADFGARINRQVQQAARRAEAASRRAAQRARVRVNARVGRWNWDMFPGGAPASAGMAGSPVSDEERMTVLRMLAEKKITTEEAEKLLSALGE